MARGHRIDEAIKRNRRVLGGLYARWGTEFLDSKQDEELFAMKLLRRDTANHQDYLDYADDTGRDTRVPITISVDDVLAFGSDEAYLEWIETEYAIRRVTQ